MKEMQKRVMVWLLLMALLLALAVSQAGIALKVSTFLVPESLSVFSGPLMLAGAGMAFLSVYINWFFISSVTRYFLAIIVDSDSPGVDRHGLTDNLLITGFCMVIFLLGGIPVWTNIDRLAVIVGEGNLTDPFLVMNLPQYRHINIVQKIIAAAYYLLIVAVFSIRKKLRISEIGLFALVMAVIYVTVNFFLQGWLHGGI